MTRELPSDLSSRASCAAWNCCPFGVAAFEVLIRGEWRYAELSL